MNKRGKFSRLIFVLIIAIILVVSITLSNKSEKYLIINDENLKAKVDIFLKNFFMFENFDREISNSIDTSNVGMFFTMTDEKLLYIYEKRFLVNLRENSEKKNINYDIEIKEICEGDKGELKVLFEYSRSFYSLIRSKECTEQTLYEAILLKNKEDFNIERIYEAESLNRDSLLDLFYSKDKLYEKYIEDEFIKYKNLSRMMSLNKIKFNNMKL
ncbi:hypothetical protein [Clostridium perfringens]|uniref:Uncharacterized protein n=3 Tax=Clostridium perfringens TaxID=1502 RepID=A0A6G4ZBL4_CLOPF|nr:hypothetical protein [Clostridium perfringens]EIF6289513.1 hypothetical protein [Clostridium perfringens]EJT5930903.1 hypothetical protein [Clostridium perfringens]EJT6162166.1 hypothetical protein [Clostridium perfringens]EJT6476959.1 hypothetical protein [Clostridium perfringens]EJT6504650.1 hypothetical protein [Clostridium perfringens]